MSLSVAALCLSLTMYEEARSEPKLAFNLVGEVVLTRAINKDVDVCEVILKRKQFTWVGDNGIKSVFGIISHHNKVLRDIKPKDLKAMQLAEAKAYKMLSPEYQIKSKFNHFYSGSAPYWAKGKNTYKVGGLYFLKL